MAESLPRPPPDMKRYAFLPGNIHGVSISISKPGKRNIFSRIGKKVANTGY
jgi:hypothetical protein